MDNNELLIQIEKLLDRKLEERIAPLGRRLDSLEGKVQSINDRLTAVEEDLISVKRTCLRVENEIIPKLDALYEDRIPRAEFSRLSDRVEKNTHMLLVMKDVIINHSGEIQHLKEVK